MSRPDVSVLTVCLNYARFLPDAIASTAAQEGVTVQHVVQDGGSTDGTRALLEASGVDWRSEPDEGISDALNRAIRRAEGRWIGWLNADEFYLPDALRTLVSAGDRHDAGLVYGDLFVVDRDARLEKLRTQHRYDRFSMRRFGPHIASCAMLVRRDLLGDEPWDPGLHAAMDWDLYLRLDAGGARFRYEPYPAGAFRLHGDQVTAEDRSWRHDLPRLRRTRGIRRNGFDAFAGLAKHRAIKLVNGGFLRQARVRRDAGMDLRWFADAGTQERVLDLIRRSRPGGRPPASPRP